MSRKYHFLSKINLPEELHLLRKKDLPSLAEEMRDYILDVLSVKKGHLGANLGVVELTIALHYHLNTPTDLLMWDVGHQAYVHKILTGRKDEFLNLRQKGGISGFPSRKESQYDIFGVGHSSTSISAITGMALADKLIGEKRKRFAVIGDASIVSGMALEGLNHLGNTDLDVCVVLNDNNIGIDCATGALRDYFNKLKEGEDTFFKDLGFHYEGVIDGHNFSEIFKALDKLDKVRGPKILHVRTLKGKGYSYSEQNQVLWHSPGKFDKETGVIETDKKTTYPAIVGETLGEILEKNQKTVVITPAMLSGSGLMEVKKRYPNRVFDVGIAEQHAVTLSAGLATQGIIPFCVIYSTFLQRAYDQIIHDVALQELPVIFLIDRAGLVGSDGVTHQGYFDISFMNTIPNMIVAAPMDEVELKEMIHKSVYLNQPIAIRYSKTKAEQFFIEPQIKLFKAKKIKKGEKLVILSTGNIGLNISKALNLLSMEKVGWVHFPFIKPLDEVMLREVFKKYNRVITYEEGVRNGGFGQSCLDVANKCNWKGEIEICSFPDQYIEHAHIDEQEEEIGFSVEQILNKIKYKLKEINISKI